MQGVHQNHGMSITTPETRDSLTFRVATEIRVLLLRRGLNGAQLAQQLGVSPMWVSYRLTGRQEIGLNDLARIAGALDVEPHALVTAATKGPTLRQHVTAPAVPHPAPHGAPSRPPNRPGGRASGPGRTSRTRAPYAA